MAKNINHKKVLVGKPTAPSMKSKAMKRIGNLYEKIIAVENLDLADKKARRGKLRSYGVRRHDKNREANILALHEALKNKTFKTSPYETFTIHDPKEREIYRLPCSHSLEQATLHIPKRLQTGAMQLVGLGKA